MIAIARKNLNLSRLIANFNSFICKSRLPFSVPIHDFSTQKESNLVFSTKLYDALLHNHHFSPEAVSHINRSKCPEKALSLLSFLKESGFSRTQLERIVKSDPRILLRSVEGIRSILEIFQSLGLSSSDIVKMVTRNQAIIQVTATKTLISSLSVLKWLLGSDYEVARLLRKSGLFLTNDLGRNLIPNVEILKSCGVPMDRIVFFLYIAPRGILVKPDMMRQRVGRAREMGFNPSSGLFVQAVRIIGSMSIGVWELKLQTFRDLGFSDGDIMAMFRKLPSVLGGSVEKTKKVTELLLATGEFTISCIVNNPAALGCSVEKRYKPRLQVLGCLENKNLIEKWPSLSLVYNLSDDKFFERFIRPYSNELAEYVERFESKER